MYKMSDELLMESYLKALNFKLNPEFVHILKAEIHRRSLLKSYKKPS